MVRDKPRRNLDLAYGWCCTKQHANLQNTQSLSLFKKKLKTSLLFHLGQLLVEAKIVKLPFLVLPYALPRTLDTRAAPLSDEKNTKVLLAMPRSCNFFRILPTLSSNSLTASPYLTGISLKLASRLVGRELPRVLAHSSPPSNRSLLSLSSS